ncbi:unnamed protein product [Durusdinium trenchii]|uniref:fructose-bisphosphate aldolase n=1 Tax=Durusdinium trenchii TaxID=1381693 RepID=A0ABP0MQ58_9DINO
MKAGVVTGDLAWALLQHAKEHKYAIPAFNCTSSSTINSVLEAGKELNRPVMIQFSEGGSAFVAGKALPNEKGKLQASILGAVAGAHFARAVAPAYGIPVLVHSDHCAKKLLPWFDGMLEADEAYFKEHGEPLFSSHMLDLSEEPDEENIAICEKYLKRMAPMKLILEMEIGITGGVEDGVDNSGAAKEKLYSTPQDVFAVYKGLNPISPMFTIAAAFGNVHGVYKAGNVVLKPEILQDMQDYAREQIKASTGKDIERPLNFVFHGGSGSEKHHIATALNAGVVKMNVDTDTQWAYWEGLLKFYKSKEGYLQGQIGNPEGEDKPNKSYYDPRKWIRECEVTMVKRVKDGLQWSIRAGVVTGDLAWSLLQHAKEHKYAIPAFNCTSSSTINSVLEAGKELNRPVMIQFSEGGSAFVAGKSLPNEKGKLQASILGAVAGAHFARAVAPAYGIPVLVHSDHCAKKLLPWFDGMLEADEAYFKEHGEPLFSSHMLDLSEEPDEENIAICEKYLKRMAPMKLILEMEIGITGGVEDGVDNSGAAKEKLYSTPQDVFAVYKGLNPISPMFTIAAAFGNVHGVYKAGNVVLKPEILQDMQDYAREQIKASTGKDIERPLNFVFHGGSGSEKHHIATALNAGVVKMNVDTDTQWAYWEGLLKFYKAKEGYLQGQIGNPEGEDKPNKSYYDPRKWIRECEVTMVKRVKESCADLSNVNA